MHIIIAGYGRVGRSLAHEFETRGHTVAVIDRDPAVFEGFDGVRGRKIAGEAFDRETLERAGIANADCLCATTSGDNSNFVAARVAKDRYGVGIVIARIYEPRRAVIYRDVGIDTISSVEWATGQFLSRIPGEDGTLIAPAPAASRIVRGEPHTTATPIGAAASGSRILIIGGGKSGSYLAERLRKEHPVTLVEVRADKIERLSHAMPDVEVLHGDGCEPQMLERAGAPEADFVAAATGDDEDNLVVSHLVRTIGGNATMVARINHPANEWLFTPEWGVDVPVGAAAGLYQAVAERCEVPLTD
jgi:Trk K+ transport system NAD-binding subunit